MKSPFRQEALDKLYIELTKPIERESPLSWVALLGVTVLIAVVIIWSFTAYLPETITAVGAVSAKHQTNTLYSDVLGQLDHYSVRQGDTIAPNQIVCYVQTALGELKPVRSSQAGVVARTLVSVGEYIGEQNENNESVGRALLRIDPDTQIRSPQVVVFYIPQKDVGKIAVGMETHVALTSQKSQTFGHMIGRVTNIDTYATTTKDLIRLHGSELGMRMEDEPVAVTCELLCADEAYPTQSGYWWSNPKGNKLIVANGDRCNVKVIVKQIHPIEKFLTKLKEVWEGMP